MSNRTIYRLLGPVREYGRPILILSVGAVILGGGIKYYLAKKHGTLRSPATHSKVSQAQDAKKGDDDEEEEMLSVHSHSNAGASSKAHSVKMKIEFPLKEGAQKHPEAKAQVHAVPPENKYCGSSEFRGHGLKKAQISKEDWKVLMDGFHQSKNILRTWLKTRKTELPEKNFAFFENQLDTLKLLRPPALDEPDLNWRGLGVWTRDEAGNNSIRMSSGFAKLFLRQPKRGQFEMTRLVAQSLAPCELDRIGLDPSWKPLLSCLEIEDSQGCSSSSVSEAGWAVSTALAVRLSPPGCPLSAFEAKDKQQCLNQFVAVGGSESAPSKQRTPSSIRAHARHAKGKHKK